MPTVDLNLFVKAPTQYTGVTFNSYANFNGYKLAASSSGLYEVCCGDSDEGSNIVSSFAPIKTDFGIKNVKRIRYVYLGVTTDEPLSLVLSTDSVSSRTFVIPANSDGDQKINVTIPRYEGFKGRYWTFNILNTLGCRFSIDSIDVGIIILSERYVK